LSQKLNALNHWGSTNTNRRNKMKTKNTILSEQFQKPVVKSQKEAKSIL